MASKDALLDKPVNTEKTIRSTRCGPCCDYSEANARDAFWDNYKALCAFFVLLMHFAPLTWFIGVTNMTSTIGRVWVNSLGFVYLFAMPGFCFVSGYYSKTELNRAQRVNLIRYTVTWFINHGLWVALDISNDIDGHRTLWEQQHPYLNQTNALLKAEGKPTRSPPGYLPVPWFRATGLDWYLFCVIIWRCFLPLLAQLRASCLPAMAVMMGIGIMFTDASASVYSNAVFAFLPFFLLGYCFQKRPVYIERIRESSVVRALLAVVALVWSAEAVLDRQLGLYMFFSQPMGCIYGGETGAAALFDISDMLKAKVNLTEIAHPTPFDISKLDHCRTVGGVAQVLLFYIVASLAVLSLMSVTPTKRIPFMTRAGTNAMYVYFGQLWALIPFDIMAMVIAASGCTVPVALAILFSFLAVFFVWVLLSQPCFKCCCKPCIEPGVERGCFAIVAQEERV
eukprot:TRINITY_DN94918_c0_g1_i1.p1 TRINITY_DN94918_c0_g1~~TRINITY_DN94918_c0_g1_i1.p1  ORF type:complete len:453 (-),score=43.19 TRINITY_DN94918_c0_g1_i1:281-1639(-)